MSLHPVWAIFAAILFTTSVATAQDAIGNLGNANSSIEARELNFSTETVDITTVQQRASASATLFKTDTRTTTIPVIAAKSNAQQEVVSRTLQLIAAAMVVCFIVICTFVYSSQRNLFGANSGRKRSQW